MAAWRAAAAAGLGLVMRLVGLVRAALGGGVGLGGLGGEGARGLVGGGGGGLGRLVRLGGLAGETNLGLGLELQGVATGAGAGAVGIGCVGHGVPFGAAGGVPYPTPSRSSSAAVRPAVSPRWRAV